MHILFGKGLIGRAQFPPEMGPCWMEGTNPAHLPCQAGDPWDHTKLTTTQIYAPSSVLLPTLWLQGLVCAEGYETIRGFMKTF